MRIRRNSRKTDEQLSPVAAILASTTRGIVAPRSETIHVARYGIYRSFL